MLGRKSYTQEELNNCKTAVQQQLSAYQKLVGELVQKDLKEFESLFFNNMILVLDRYFVHRIRTVTGKDTNPLNEVEMLSDSIMNNNGILRGINAIKYIPGQSVLKLQIGDPIKLTEANFEDLSSAFILMIEEKFLQD